MVNDIEKESMYRKKLIEASKNPIPFEYTGVNKFPEIYEKHGVFANNEEDYKVLLDTVSWLYASFHRWSKETLSHEKAHADKAREIYGTENVNIIYGVAFENVKDGQKELALFTNIAILNGLWTPSILKEIYMAPENPSPYDYKDLEDLVE